MSTAEVKKDELKRREMTGLYSRISEELLEAEVLRTELEEVVEPVPSPVRRTVWP